MFITGTRAKCRLRVFVEAYQERQLADVYAVRRYHKKGRTDKIQNLDQKDVVFDFKGAHPSKKTIGIK